MSDKTDKIEGEAEGPEDTSRFVGTKDSVRPMGRFVRTQDNSTPEDKRNRADAERAKGQ